jgi:hypothetical protein
MADDAMTGIDVHRTGRGWHVINTANGDHWEAANQSEVLQSVDTYRKNLAKAAADAKAQDERNANPQLAEFGTSVPGEPQAFEQFVPVSETAPVVPDVPESATAEPAPVERSN